MRRDRSFDVGRKRMDHAAAYERRWISLPDCILRAACGRYFAMWGPTFKAVAIAYTGFGSNFLINCHYGARIWLASIAQIRPSGRAQAASSAS